jgi:hypothetical protein
LNPQKGAKKGWGCGSVARAFVIEGAGEALIERGGATGERFVGGALASGCAALAALSGALIAFKTEVAIAPLLIAALRAWTSEPIVVLAAMIAIHADRHTAER